MTTATAGIDIQALAREIAVGLSAHALLDASDVAKQLCCSTEDVLSRQGVCARLPAPLDLDGDDARWMRGDVDEYAAAERYAAAKRSAYSDRERQEQLREAQMQRAQMEGLVEALERRVAKMSAKQTALTKALRSVATAGPVSSAAGVYLLLDTDDHVVYVGQSTNVVLRLAGHREKEFVNVRMVKVESATQRSQLEELLIKTWQPKYNIALNDAARGRAS